MILKQIPSKLHHETLQVLIRQLQLREAELLHARRYKSIEAAKDSCRPKAVDVRKLMKAYPTFVLAGVPAHLAACNGLSLTQPMYGLIQMGKGPDDTRQYKGCVQHLQFHSSRSNYLHLLCGKDF